MSKRKTTAPAPSRAPKQNTNSKEDAAGNRKFVIVMVVATIVLIGLLWMMR